jgi:hypothetical protein
MLCLATSAYAETPEIPDSTKNQPSSVKYDDCFWQQKLHSDWHLKASVKKLLENFNHLANGSYNSRELHDDPNLKLSFEYRY